MSNHQITRCQVIAEVAQAHDGSLGMAHAYIDAAARAGADAVKFQCHIADAESSSLEPWRTKFSLQDATRFDYWRRMEFTEEQWHGLKKHCTEKNLKFLCSPFSVEAVELLTRVGVSAWKIASGEVTNDQMLSRIVATRLPVFLSTGMSSLKEIDEGVRLLQSHHVDVTVFQCTSAYPCPPERVGLNLIPFFRSRYGCGVGLSDHSGTIYPGLAAATHGIEALEIHVTFSREMFGPDVRASVTIDELKQLVDGIRFIEQMRAHPVDKDEQAKEVAELRSIFMKSVFVRREMVSGETVTEDDLVTRKPGTGIPACKLKQLVGRKLRRPVSANFMLAEDDFE